MADIFISYRRGEGDSPNAGRIYDYLVSQGYSVFYDQDEASMPTGEPFPEILTKAVESSRVILAVIGKSWIEQMPRLSRKDDWVREELRRADPTAGRQFIPIYMGAHPKQLGDGLPADLGFISAANSHCLWGHFEASEKRSLIEILGKRLPRTDGNSQPGNVPRPELLCDRSRAEAQFRCTLNKGQRGWLLLGGADQAQQDFFHRLNVFTLPRTALATKYPSHLMIRLDLHEFYGRPLEEVRDHLFQRCADDLKNGDISSWDTLRTELTRRKYSLVLFCAVASGADVRQADWWEARFTELLEEISRIQGEPPLSFALALRHETKRAGLLSYFKKDVSHHLAERHPNGRCGTEETATTSAETRFAVIWLCSAKRLDVEDWWRNRHVQPYYSQKREEASLQPFEATDQIPMEKMLNHLAQVLEETADPQENHR